MDVTRENFKILFPKIDEEIKNCEYLSFDCEFSGVPEQCHNFFDDAEERYQMKMKKGMKYNVVQFGLSIFSRNDENDLINCSSYNFYIFKYRVRNSILPDHQMNISCSAFSFLAANSFDFNKLFKHGINYCNVEEEQKLRASLKTKNDEILLHDRFDLKRQKLVYEALIKFNEFMIQSDKETVEFGPYEKSELNLIKSTIEKADQNLRVDCNLNSDYLSDGCNLKFTIYRHLNTDLWKLLIKKIETRENEQFLQFDNEAIADESLGFSKIIQSIILHRKPLVGHNVLLDIMHIIHQFVALLPAKYEDFQFITKELFPFIYDTKHMSVFLENLTKQKVKSLADLYEYFKSNYPSILSKIKLENSESDQLSQANFHHAGFDSYITGCCFEVLKNLAEEDSKKPINEDVRFRNKFYNAWSLDIPYLTSESDQDVKPDRDNVFYIEFYDIPSEFEQSLSKTLSLESNNFQFHYLDNNSCLVAIPNSKIQSLIDQIGSNKKLKIIKYDNYKKLKNQMNQSSFKKMKTLSDDSRNEEKISNVDLIRQTSVISENSDTTNSVDHKISFNSSDDSNVEMKKPFKEEW